MTEVVIPAINALIVHDGDGDRLFVKYYDGRTKAQQLEFEQLLQKKTKSLQAKSDGELLIVDNEVIVFRYGSDCRFYVVGSNDENELILTAVLDSIYDSISALMKGQVEKRMMLDNLELVLLTIDETIDNGQIMELDSTAVVGRVLMRGSEQSHQNASQSQPQTSGSDLTLSQAFGLARDSFFKTLGKEFLK